jgi:hypothetical protein
VTNRTDDFNRANGGLGANWTAIADAAHGASLAIVSNKVVVGTANNDCASLWTADTFADDQYAEATHVAGTSDQGCIVRGRTSPNIRYYDFLSGSGGGLLDAIEYYDGTTWNAIALSAGGSGSGVVRCEVTGTLITGKVNGTTKLTVTDATLSSGVPGMHLYDVSNTATMDDWLGGPIVFGRVQGGVHNNGASSSTTCAVTVSAVGSGHTICGLVSWDNTTNPGATVSVSDDKGNTYNVETISTDTTNNQKTTAFSLTNITNAPTVFTATLSAANAFCSILVEEFSGVSRASSDERDGAAHGGQFQNSPGTGTDGITSGTFTTNTNGDLLWGCCTDNVLSPALASNGTGFSTGTQDSVDYTKQSEFKTQPTAGSGTAATFTQAVNDQRIAYLIALKADGAVAAANPPYQPHYQRAPILAQ